MYFIHGPPVLSTLGKPVCGTPVDLVLVVDGPSRAKSASVLGSWGKAMRDAVRNKERW